MIDVFYRQLLPKGLGNLPQMLHLDTRWRYINCLHHLLKATSKRIGSLRPIRPNFGDIGACIGRSMIVHCCLFALNWCLFALNCRHW